MVQIPVHVILKLAGWVVIRFLFPTFPGRNRIHKSPHRHFACHRRNKCHSYWCTSDTFALESKRAGEASSARRNSKMLQKGRQPPGVSKESYSSIQFFFLFFHILMRKPIVKIGTIFCSEKNSVINGLQIHKPNVSFN